MTEGDTPPPTPESQRDQEEHQEEEKDGVTMMTMPDKPIMGGIEKYSDTKFAIWTGGKPNHDWTQLVQPTGFVHP